MELQNPALPEPEIQRLQSLERMTLVIYALQAASIFFGVSLIAAVIVNYIKRDDVLGTWLASHFRWQIRTFWYTLLWLGLGCLLFIVVIGYFILIAAGIWLIYRVAKGWVFLSEKKPMYAPAPGKP
ncbi:MAG: DUF4870 family protein [Trichloromonadaceae bacterium]